MALLLKRRYNLRLLTLAGLILLTLLFFMLLIQFSQIEKTNSSISNKKNQYRNLVNEEQERLKRIENLNYRVANRFGLVNQNYDSEIEQVMKSEFSKTMKKLQKLVHLDLKGSPPKLNYLKELIPFFKKSGATGVIVEYEDFFPYNQELESIANQNHYTISEVKQIFDLIKENELTLIPLIQTYGHLEFVLKLKEFSYLREAPKHYQVITPCINDTYNKVLFKMIDQILEIHPDSLEYIHIGCDEVYHININPACKSLPHLKTTQDFFLYHLNILIDYIKSKRPSLNVMIWEDMIRHNMISNVDNNLKQFAKRIVPVVWNYREEVAIGENVWRVYDDIFSEIWLASAFKGATNQMELIPNAQLHFSNHISWINMMKSFPSPHKIKGIILTGWSRYDHLQAICEILPAGLPSLVLCLQTLTNFDQEDSIIFSKTREITKCNYNQNQVGFILDPTKVSNLYGSYSVEDITNIYKCEFPGSHLYNWLLGLKLTTLSFENRHDTYSNILNKYNLKNNFFNTMIFENALSSLYPSYKNKFRILNSMGEKEFDKYFYGDLFEELSNVYILKYIDIIEQRIIELNKTKIPDNAPVRPFNAIKIVQSML